MSILSRRRSAVCRFLIFLLALASWPALAGAQDGSAKAVPLNAHAKSYGSGWECDRGYQKVRGSCVAIAVPPNAYLDSLGRGWDCNRGYRKANGTCARIEVPRHAFLGSGRDGWKCERGYRRTDRSCVPISVPENAYLTSSGDRWECERGFQKRDAACLALAVPSNAYLDSSGRDWKCERGFKRSLTRARFSAGHRTPTSPTRETAGPAMSPIGSRARPVPRATDGGSQDARIRVPEPGIEHQEAPHLREL
jgi:hypothetical protein